MLDFLACPTPGIKRTKGPRSQGQKSQGQKSQGQKSQGQKGQGSRRSRIYLSKEEAVQLLHSIVNCLFKQ